MKHRRGFTLLELMVVVAVVAILASIAYPSYRESVLKGRRAQARAALYELMQQQERTMTQRNTYLKFANAKGSTTPASARDSFKVFSGDRAAGTAYWLQADNCAAPNQSLGDCVLLKAMPVQADAAAGTLWLNSLGEKGCNGNRPGVCWQ